MDRRIQKSKAAIIGMDSLEFNGAYGFMDEEKSGNPKFRKIVFIHSSKKVKIRSTPLEILRMEGMI